MTYMITYETVKQILDSQQISSEAYTKINYGLQFYVICDGEKELLRIYEGKKGTRIDLSQVKNPTNKIVLEQYLSSLIPKLSPLIPKQSAIQTPVPETLIGTDESGKGDYFGPLCVAAVYTTAPLTLKLKEIGVCDSKQLHDTQILKLATQIQTLCPNHCCIIHNALYNKTYSKFNNLNKLLAWGHGQAIEKILKKVQCADVLIDQFGPVSLMENEIKKKSLSIRLHQFPNAETHLAVAAASILARAAFVSKLHGLEKKYNCKLPKGCPTHIAEYAKKFIDSHGQNTLNQVAKLHFKCTPI